MHKEKQETERKWAKTTYRVLDTNPKRRRMVLKYLSIVGSRRKSDFPLPMYAFLIYYFVNNRSCKRVCSNATDIYPLRTIVQIT